MLLRLIAICLIYFATAIAWLFLGATIFRRSDSSGEGLRGRVESTWGTVQSQAAPAAIWYTKELKTEQRVVNGKQTEVETVAQVPHSAAPLSSRIQVNLSLDYRQKGLLWYSTYGVQFDGVYQFENPSDEAQKMQLSLHLPASKAIYDNLTFEVNGAAVEAINENERAYVVRAMQPHETVKVRMAYHSQGMDSWHYSFGADVNRVRDFQLTMETNFKDIDFPENTLSPGSKQETANGWKLEWTYKNLVSGFEIAMAMPKHLQPGPLAGEISLFAPVSLFFFFFLMLIITTLRGIELHPVNYFFLAAAFFAFHLMLAYMVDHFSIHVSFLIASAVSVALVTSYLRLVIGTQFALREAAIAQILYLVLFSYAFFFKGYTGLAITIGSVLTLFAVMQLTGRIRWADHFKKVA